MVVKTVYDYFIEYYTSLSGDTTVPDNISEGIYAYLNSIGLIDVSSTDNDCKRIASRELMRFKLMPLNTFVAFFNNFAIRQNIDKLIDECRSMALKRRESELKISNEEYKDKMTDFYNYAQELISDYRYDGWVNEKLEVLKELLDYSVGNSNTVPYDIEDLYNFEYST